MKLVICCKLIDCKTVRIFAYSSTREQSNKRSGMRLKTESETGERRHALPISLLIFRNKNELFCSLRRPRLEQERLSQFQSAQATIPRHPPPRETEQK